MTAAAETLPTIHVDEPADDDDDDDDEGPSVMDSGTLLFLIDI